MGYIFVALGLGFFIGYRRMLNEKMIALNGKLQNVWLFLLIFSMGMKIGMDKDILQQLPALGGRALLYAVASSAGSVLVVYIISKVFFREEGEK